MKRFNLESLDALMQRTWRRANLNDGKNSNPPIRPLINAINIVIKK